MAAVATHYVSRSGEDWHGMALHSTKRGLFELTSEPSVHPHMLWGGGLASRI
jgi:hypothetical protein